MSILDNCSDKNFHPLTIDYCITDGWLDLSDSSYMDPGYIKFIHIPIKLVPQLNTVMFKIGYVIAENALYINSWNSDEYIHFEPFKIQNPTIEDLQIYTTQEYLTSRFKNI